VELPDGGTIEQGRQQLETDVIPQVKSSPGFVAGHFLAPASGHEGLSVLLYNDEQSARAAEHVEAVVAHAGWRPCGRGERKALGDWLLT